ncbi:hypothetical protein JFV29_16755 [Peribacillus sp. TH16]|uniref:hypothetical protein n=1 Tax=Peribacillus sp. TH16 TaxID=2798482 RepID=UPI001913C66C|nr:hypothetical protein [Peribacillus sp. TH16]MBK5483498.1 hypothetical protein [Peribacillus sp. TH16]
MIRIFYNKIYSFIDGITITSINYLTWTSAVVVALLALTTIIFSQYNERQIIKSNDISRQIKEAIKEVTTPELTIQELVNELIYVLSNQNVYKLTLRFFFIISYLSGLTWLISGIGYILLKDKLSSGDFIVILLSLITIVITFFILPLILIKFNNKPPIDIDTKNRVSYGALIRYLKSITSISADQLIKKYINPTIEFSLSYSNNLTIALKQQIPLNNIYYVFKFVGVDNQAQIICINNLTNDDYVEYSIISKDKNENSFRGLLNMIRNSTHQQLFVFSKDKTLISTYKMTSSQISNNQFSFKINSSMQLSTDDQIDKVLSAYKYKFKTFSNSETKNQYKLLLKNKK